MGLYLRPNLYFAPRSSSEGFPNIFGSLHRIVSENELHSYNDLCCGIKETNFVHCCFSAKHNGKFKGSGSPWPPYRIPSMASDPYTDPRHILLSRVLQGVLFVIFYKAVHTTQLSDQVIALAVYLLEMALSVCESIGSTVSTQ